MGAVMNKVDFNLLQTIELFGLKNLVFTMKVESNDFRKDGEVEICAMKISEHRYKVSENYKVSFIEINGRSDVYLRDMYISDFETNVNTGLVGVYVKNIDGYQPIIVPPLFALTEEDYKAVQHIESNVLLHMKYLPKLEIENDN